MVSPSILVLILLFTVFAFSIVDSTHVVGARIESCTGCRLDRLPKLKTFLKTKIHNYPAVDLVWIGAKDPEIIFLDKFKRKVSHHDLAHYDEAGLERLLEEHGITTSTPKPTYDKQPIAPTPHCHFWIQTEGCDPHGKPEEGERRSCHDHIEDGWSGYCECGDGRRYNVGCKHDVFTCETVCKKLLQGDEL
eukprot:PhF_6_TR14895/c0_g1_i2/m.23229